MYDLHYSISSSIKIIVWDGIKLVEPVLQFCLEFNMMFTQFIIINFLGPHDQFSSLEPSVDLSSSLNHSVVTACVYTVEH